MKRLALLLWLGLTALASAQQPPPPAAPTIGAYNGQELIRLQNNAGSAGQIILNHIRNTVGYALIPGGGTVNTVSSWYQGYTVATGAITTWNINLPNPAPDGMLFEIANSTAAAFTSNVTVTTVAGSQTQTLATAYNSQTLAANGGNNTWLFALTSPSSSIGTWYKVE